MKWPPKVNQEDFDWVVENVIAGNDIRFSEYCDSIKNLTLKIFNGGHFYDVETVVRYLYPRLKNDEVDKRVVHTLKRINLDRRGSLQWRSCRLGVELIISLSESQNWRCCYCGVKTNLNTEPKATIEHVKRIADGGTDEYFNLVMACEKCNNLKGDIDEKNSRF
jgi:5-methylcytosine-specific restriction endonuclease McrA